MSVSSGGPKKRFPVKFHLPSGETVALQFEPTEEISRLKEKLWEKKGGLGQPREYSLRLTRSDIYLKDSDKLQRILDLNVMFRENLQNQMIEVTVVPNYDIGDKKKRDSKRATKGQLLMSGYLNKRGPSKTSSWKRRYFVFQYQTLFYFENEDTYRNMCEALDMIPMGSCAAVPIPQDADAKHPYVFELQAEHIRGKNFLLSTDDEAEYKKWIAAISAFNFQRTKSVFVLCAEELARRGLKSEGLFRVSGSKENIKVLKAAFDNGESPVLEDYKDDHTLSGLMKLVLRQLKPEPLLTFDLYQRFLAVDAMATIEDKLLALRQLHDQLPVPNQGFLRYLIRFLREVAQDADVNMMTSKNLAIVFGPNILRAQEENMFTSMNHSNAVINITALMIDAFELIWPEEAGTGFPPSYDLAYLSTRGTSGSMDSEYFGGRSASQSIVVLDDDQISSLTGRFRGSSTAIPRASSLLQSRGSLNSPTASSGSPFSSRGSLNSPTSLSGSPFSAAFGGPPSVAVPSYSLHSSEPSAATQISNALSSIIFPQIPQLSNGAVPEPVTQTRAAFQRLHEEWVSQQQQGQAMLMAAFDKLEQAFQAKATISNGETELLHGALEQHRMLMRQVELSQAQLARQLHSMASSLTTTGQLSQSLNSVQQQIHNLQASVASNSSPASPASPSSPASPVSPSPASLASPASPAVASPLLVASSASAAPAALSSEPPSQAQAVVVGRGRALYAYEGGIRPDELKLVAGDVIEILSKSGEGGWWQGRKADTVGWFPASYVEEILA